MSAPLAPIPLGELARAGIVLGARAAMARMATRAGIAVAMAAVLLAALAGRLEHRAAASQAVDRALASVFDLVIPLASFALVSIVVGRQRLQDAVWPLARFGADRRFVAAGQVLAAAAAAALVGGLAALLAVVMAHGPTSQPLARDALTSGWIGALTAGAYAGWLSLGATFLRGGGGRIAVLLVDFLVGGVGLVAWVMPRGLAMNLLGLVATELPQRGASAALVVTTAATVALAALRCGR